MKQTSLPSLVLLFFVIIAATVRAESTTLMGSQLEQAKEHLRISEAMQAQMLAEFDKLQASGEASAEQLEQFRTYLERINHTVDEQRKALALLMTNSPARSAAESVAPAAPASTLNLDISASVVETDEERLSKLDRQLDDALSEFDDMLLIEQEEIANRQSSAGGGGGGGGGASQAGSEGESGTGEASSSSGQQQAIGTQTGESASARESATSGAETVATGSTSGPVGRTNERSSGGTVPPGIPDGRDDDVVARQLREAAENEPDPALRAKLWEEYRKYKNTGS